VSANWQYLTTDSDPNSCKRLWRYVLHQQFLDVKSNQEDKEYLQLKIEALQYLTSNSQDLEIVCDYAGLDLDYFKRKISPIKSKVDLEIAIMKQILASSKHAKNPTTILWWFCFSHPALWRQLLAKKIAQAAGLLPNIKPFHVRMAKSFLTTRSEELRLICSFARVKYEPFLRKYQQLYPKYNLGKDPIIRRCAVDKKGQYNFADLLNPLEMQRPKKTKANIIIHQPTQFQQLELL
jgi:hypothetical protein